MMRVVLRLDPNPPYFQQVSPTHVTYDARDPVVMIYIGDCNALARAIQANPSIIFRTAEGNSPLIYLAARAGHNDVVQLLFRYGADVNARGNHSSPLHAATYFGHVPVVKQLMALGASVTFRNSFGRLPVDDASCQAVRDVIMNANVDDLEKMLRQLKDQRLSGRVETIVHENKIVGYRVLRNLEHRRTITKTWKLGWHGTTETAVASIFKSGLKKPGDSADGFRIQERENHYQPGYVVAGQSDWSRAVFLSPILTYAAHPCYADKVSSVQGSGQWCIIVHAYVRPYSYSTHSSTILGRYAKQGEAFEEEEMRAAPGDDEKEVRFRAGSIEIVRVSENANVTVAAVLLANDDFLQTTSLSADHLSRLMQGSDAH
jgi:hypothetical protein